VKDQLLKLKADLGRTGLLALALLAVAFSFHALVVAPLQAKNAGLALTLSQKSPAAVARSGEKLAKVYDALGREETATDWLAKLYAISKATGVEMPSANYKMDSGAKDDASARIQRYEIVLPVTATYGQLRDFLGRALAEIPVLSLDQLSLKRESRNQDEVQAELRLTLHLVKP
jgi:hypothetical protein